jgi:hypothetical protein
VFSGRKFSMTQSSDSTSSGPSEPKASCKPNNNSTAGLISGVQLNIKKDKQIRAKPKIQDSSGAGPSRERETSGY